MLRNEYLVAENRILRDQIKGCLQLSDAERQTLAEIGKKLVKKALEEMANIVKPDTILGWLVEAAAHLVGLSHHVLQEAYLEQVQMDELFALLSAVMESERHTPISRATHAILPIGLLDILF